jgi:hypothetical protein
MLHLLHHTLGLRPDHRESYRNHFVAGPGHHDQPDLEALELAGLMKRAPTPGFCEAADVVFVCTKAGKEYAINNLPPESPKPRRSNYSKYLNADTGHSFYEWLGINRPEYEMRGFPCRCEYRMVRKDRSYFQINADIYGDWKPTKKAAKESYKAALKASKGAPT